MEVDKRSRKVGRYLVSTSFNGPWWKICWENTGAGMGFEEPQAVLPEQRTSGAEIPGRVGAERGGGQASTKQGGAEEIKPPPNMEIIRAVCIKCSYLL